MGLEVMTPVELRVLADRVREAAEARYRADVDRATDTPVEELVTAGMAWLDEHAPGHVERFDPGTFDVMCSHERLCVLMQGFETDSWDEVTKRARYLLADGDFDLHGFTVDYDSRIAERYERYAMHDRRVRDLNEAWLAAYAARRGN